MEPSRSGSVKTLARINNKQWAYPGLRADSPWMHKTGIAADDWVAEEG